MTNENSKKYTAKKDRYSRARGGNSRFLNIFCATCASHIALYQKDGRGALLRMYLDRIVAPPVLATLQHQSDSKKDVPYLKCSKCETLIGIPMMYTMESRVAFHLVHGSFAKKNSDGTYPPKP